ncbi:hypothetical protein Presley_94 [Acinetobacter phage Presley]|uniref:Uncharacterized protein n=1 Tax=Acinetobacter phage Presley TaxID=1406780 RepID=U5PWN0_9CAUD|nr:hypothetical protein Presley_94 [Acinetobacter phage Presley]AGY48161.1 hypothetical protein Presley_94 [Acinetobacter phage Presley]
MIFKITHTHHKGSTLSVLPKSQRLRVGLIREGHELCKKGNPKDVVIYSAYHFTAQLP